MTDVSSPPARLLQLDALRGFALLGILMVNIGAFASAYFGLGVGDPQFAAPLDRAVRWVVALLFETKFYLLFSFLFGYSFTLQMDSAARAGRAFVPRMQRRLLGLLLLGLAHAVLLYLGDILSTYALLGLVLLSLRGCADGQLLRWARRLIGLTALAWALLGLLLLMTSSGGFAPELQAQALAAQQAYLESPASVVAQHLRELPSTLGMVWLVQGPCALAMFLLGRLAGGQRWFEGEGWREGLRQWAPRGRPALALVLGLAGSLCYASVAAMALGDGWTLLALGLDLLTAPFLTLTLSYVLALMALFQRPAGDRWLAWLAPAGRMALSNYLLQSLVCALIFTAYGLGLMGQVAPLGGVLIALALFAAQLWLSRWWLERFAYGPAEWLLRALTLASWPRMRKQAG
ncbi:MAG: DUF418 domain-containing protein [Burkholderiaceae bacterium]|nr:DUF418 domain-containing protein [Burkholderiaceae bacterium]